MLRDIAGNGKSILVLRFKPVDMVRGELLILLLSGGGTGVKWTVIAAQVDGVGGGS